MKKIFSLLLLYSTIITGQQNLLWKGYFSYNQIKDITESSNRVIAASENALFSKNISSGELRTINTVDGMPGETISTIYHSETTNKTIVGYENGLMVVINNTDGSILNVVDIINKSIPSNIKRVNHFIEANNILYVSCDFGIVQYNLQTLQFGDTYFIGPNGAEIRVLQSTILNNEIYAVTQFYGIKKASLSNPNLIDFAQWETFDTGFWSGITTFNNQLIASNNNLRLYRYEGFFQEIYNVGQIVTDLRVYQDKIIASSSNTCLIFNENLGLIRQINPSQIPEFNSTFTCATVIGNTVFLGTNDLGVVSCELSGTTFNQVMPGGPLRNQIFHMDASTSNLWAVFGGYDIFYNPYTFIGFNLTAFGISKYSENQWTNIPYSDLQGAKSLSRVKVNPNNPTEVYISSYHNGLLKIENDVLTTIFNENNSSLESLDPSSQTESIRINSVNFDRNGNLWVANSRVKNGLSSLKTSGQWQSYNMESILTDFDDGDFSRIEIDRNGTKWMGTYKEGVIAFNESNNVFKQITEGSETGNLPSADVRALAIDNRSQVWIGTIKGLRVISSTGSYNSEDQIKANSIIILEDGLAQELLFEQSITDIKVDGSNRKWIGTADSGVFLFSENGQETIYHFTKNNSPLPSNVINDIDINETTGEIFFATDKGMVSFQGTATKPSDDLENVYVYPNPVRPEFTGTVKIAGLIADANIKITDIEGNLVYETTSEGGTIEWDTTAFGKYKVASGVYMIFIAAEDGSETTVKKVMIVR